jgi:hypothetical protein
MWIMNSVKHDKPEKTYSVEIKLGIYSIIPLIFVDNLEADSDLTFFML